VNDNGRHVHERRASAAALAGTLEKHERSIRANKLQMMKKKGDDDDVYVEEDSKAGDSSEADILSVRVPNGKGKRTPDQQDENPRPDKRARTGNTANNEYNRGGGAGDSDVEPGAIVRVREVAAVGHGVAFSIVQVVSHWRPSAETRPDRVLLKLVEQPMSSQIVMNALPESLQVLQDVLRTPVIGKNFFDDSMTFTKVILPPASVSHAKAFEISTSRVVLVDGLAMLVIKWKPIENNVLSLF